MNLPFDHCRERVILMFISQDAKHRYNTRVVTNKFAKTVPTLFNYHLITRYNGSINGDKYLYLSTAYLTRFLYVLLMTSQSLKMRIMIVMRGVKCDI